MPVVFDKTMSWVPKGEVIMSGNGNTTLTAAVNLVQPGYVAFSFKVVAQGLTGAQDGFSFVVDQDYTVFNRLDNKVFVKSTNYKYVSQNVLLEEGTHLLKWRFNGGSMPTSSTRGYYATIEQIKIFGTSLAARQDIPCKEGYFQDKEGQTKCEMCGDNTRSSRGADRCIPCEPDSYSFAASSQCINRPLCSENHYTKKYTPCVNGQRTVYYELLEPVICNMSMSTFHFNADNGTTSECPACPPGFLPETDIAQREWCVPCSSSQYVYMGQCADVPPGYRSHRSITYFAGTDSAQYKPHGGFREAVSRQALPDGFSTSCVGGCGVNGWREVNGVIDSGFHASDTEVDSRLDFNAEFVHDGSISFQYMLTALKEDHQAQDSGLAGLQFFVDGVLRDDIVTFHPVEDTYLSATVFVEQGFHVFTWVFHQPLGTFRHKKMVLEDIVVNGTASGGTTELVVCEAGTSSALGEASCQSCPPGKYSESGSASCKSCEGNTFTDYFGAAECMACGKDTVAFANHTGCDVESCIFSNEGMAPQFDLSPLNKPVSLIGSDSGRLELSICSKLRGDAMCLDENRHPVDAFSCVVDNKLVGHNAGSLMNVYMSYAGEVTPTSTMSVRLRYTHGSPCGTSGDFWRTEVSFACNTSLTEFTLPVLDSMDNCLIKYKWSHISSCPMCIDAVDYVEQAGECEDGHQTVALVRKSECNGPQVLSTEVRSCTKAFSVSLPLVIAVVALLTLLVFGIVIVGIRNKKMSERYEMLLNDSSLGSSRGSGLKDGIDDENL